MATYGSIDAALAAYPQLVEAEDGDGAEALLRGLVASEVPADRIRHAHLVAVTDHFLSYGHPLIYTQKAFDLLDAIGWQHADLVLSPLAPNTVRSTRYDRLPYMRRFMRAWEQAGLDLGRVAVGGARSQVDVDDYRKALLDGHAEAVVTALSDLLRRGASVERLIDTTATAAAERFLRFDLDLDTDDTSDLGWLDVTHTLTTVRALRWAWSVDPSPAVLRGLFHAAWFVNWAKRVDGDGESGDRPWTTADVDELRGAIERRDAEAATAMVLGWSGPEPMLERTLAEAGTADTAVSPIMVAHTVKTTRAAIEESRALDSRAPLAATARFLATPRRERWVARSTYEAMDLLSGRAQGDRPDTGD